jgi:hypothetical protein
MLFDEKKWDKNNCREQAINEIDDIIKKIKTVNEMT